MNMHEQIKQPYAVDARESERRELLDQLEKVKRQAAEQNLMAGPGTNNNLRRTEEIPDHLSVGACVNLLRNDANQLLQEIEELRARLSPVLSEQKSERVEMRGPRPPVRCEMAGELEAIHSTINQARESVYFTLAQLDL